jgi:hypothetical protein
VTGPGREEGLSSAVTPSREEPRERLQAAQLSAEFGVTVRWCPLGFEVPKPGGGIRHVSTAAAVRAILGGSR